MNNKPNATIKAQLLKLSTIIRAEQRALLLEAASCESLPHKNLLRQIAELELNIAAIDNNIAELE